MVMSHIIGQCAGEGNAMRYIFTCPKCGTANGLDSRFCVGCGEPIAILCPRCRTNLSFGTEFCVNCGLRLDWGTQQPVEERKPISGWAKFGKVLVILGILCLIAAPVIFLLPSSSDIIGVSLAGKAAIAGILNISVGLGLMRKG